MIAAIEIVAEKNPAKAFDPALKIGPRIAKRALELGVITRALPASDSLSFSPPFTVTEDELERMVSTVRAAVDDIHKELAN